MARRSMATRDPCRIADAWNPPCGKPSPSPITAPPIRRRRSAGVAGWSLPQLADGRSGITATTNSSSWRSTTARRPPLGSTRPTGVSTAGAARRSLNSDRRVAEAANHPTRAFRNMARFDPRRLGALDKEPAPAPVEFRRDFWLPYRCVVVIRWNEGQATAQGCALIPGEGGRRDPNDKLWPPLW